MCEVLKELYSEVYSEAFNYSKINDRIKLQKAVYLMENMGVYVGDYSFSWEKYGPYSLALDYDAKSCSETANIEVTFSDYAKQCIARLREFLDLHGEYSSLSWMECIAALHYLKYVFRFSDNTVMEELKTRKPHLTNDELNRKALSIANSIAEMGV